MKRQVFLSGINGSKRIVKTWKLMKKVVVKDLAEVIKMLKTFGIWWIQIDV